MSLILSSKDDFGIEHVTTVFINTRTGLQKYFIYSIVINGSTTHFNVLEDIKYIGIYNYKTNTFNIINIKDEDNIEISFEMKNQIKAVLQEKYVNLLTISNILNATVKFEMLNLFTGHYIDLKATKQQIEFLNSKFKCVNYRISIDYIFQINRNSKVFLFNDAVNILTANTLLLSIFKGDTCVSSIELIPDGSNITINRNTHRDYQNRKFIKLLTSVTIIIARSLNITKIKTITVNPTTSYLMVKYFQATAYISFEDAFEDDGEDDGEDDYEDDITTKLVSYEKHKRYLHKYKRIRTEVKIDDHNIDNAERMFDIIEKEVKCKRLTTPSKKIKNVIVQQNKSIRKIKSASNIKRMTNKQRPNTKFHSI